MSITALPVPPTRSDPVNFSARADDFLSALPTFATEANELQADVNAKQIAAANSATNAAASELAANASSNASVWVSGTTYAVGNVRYSPITYLSYRRKTAGAGTTDPSADSTNWQLINGTGNVDLNSTQTLTNKTFGSGSEWNGNAVPIANGGTGATTAAGAFNNIKQAATTDSTGVVELATSGESLNPANDTVVLTPKSLRDALQASGNANIFASRAWVNFNGTTAAIRASGNVTSVTRTSTGSYTINFTTAMSDANYAISTTRDGNGFIRVVATNTSSVSIFTSVANSAGNIGTVAEDTTQILVAVFR